MCLHLEIKETLQTDSRAAICMGFEINPDLYDLIMMDAPSGRLEVIVTTIPKDDDLWRKKIAGCRKVYTTPFILRFAIPEGQTLHGLDEGEILRYPANLFGDLLATRTWIERAYSPRIFLLSDDDPGVSYAGKAYEFRATQMIFSCPGCNASGGHRWTITPQVHHDIWRFGIALARQRGSNYLGLNGSEATKGIFCNTKFFPISCNRSVNGITAVVKGIRNRIPAVKISQEFALMTAISNAQGGGTMTLMPLIRTYAVNAPKLGSVEQSQEIISQICGQQFKAGNTGGGKGQKHNTIFHSTTVQTMTVEDLLGV
jgi:hypothetical protein